MFPIRSLILTTLLVLGGQTVAQSASLFPQGETRARGPLIAMRASAPSQGLLGSGDRLGFLVPLPEPDVPAPARSGTLAGNGATAKLLSLISEAESRHGGYDAVIHGAKIKPPKLPTELTVQEILDWIAATPGQPHAIGRYQVIPDTLRHLIADLGINPQARFSPDLQDRMANKLLADAGFHAFQRGEISRRGFMYRLAKVWAGLPLPSGESYYEGYAGNKATMTWARFDSAMAAIFPG